MKGRAHDLGGVDSSPRDQIAELASLRIEAKAIVVGVENFGDDDGAVCSGIGGPAAVPAARSLEADCLQQPGRGEFTESGNLPLTVYS